MAEKKQSKGARSYLIGVGGSGGKVISKLYARLKEENADYSDRVTCIAVDTDQGELNELAQLGVKKVCISGSETVGQLINHLGDDVTDWCPNTANEGNFFCSPVFNGASQCRLKSRLCFSNFLKNKNNSLEQALEESLMVSSNGEEAEEAPPTILIVSSIAGGTGSGIFIQVALYIKSFFKKYGIDVKIHGLFACPDLYKKVVNSQQMPSLYANAYAVIRELNAFNLICGSEKTSAYGGDIDIDIEISTSCEGRLFEKDAEGRYGDKPYDILYFIDKANYLKKIIGGLDDYYEAMANIAYSHLYADISETVLSRESNEMHAHSKAPCAVYGSAGAASIVYPYKDILKYFADRSISESVDSVWSALDKEWANYYRAKDANARSAGHSKYIPDPKERADQYIKDFERSVKSTGISTSKLAFLAPMVTRNDISSVDALLAAISQNAQSVVESDARFEKFRSECGIGNNSKVQDSLTYAIKNADSSSETSNMFSKISNIDKNLETYCKKSLLYIFDLSISFANKIFCDDKELWEAFDESDFGLIKGLLYNSGTKSWVHPVAARYLLYRFMARLDQKINDIISEIDTSADDLDDFYNYLINGYVSTQRKVLSPSDKGQRSNTAILKELIEKPFGKKSAIKGIVAYFEKLNRGVEDINDVLTDALLYFAFVKVRARVSKLIDEYELFFDNIDEFSQKAKAAVITSENIHDNSRNVVYVCASAEVKSSLYEDVGKNIDLQTGETASVISKALFDEMRRRAFAQKNIRKKTATLAETSKNMENFFNKVSDIVAESAKSNTEIQGSLDMNVFQAMLREYVLENPENAEDVTLYSESDSAKSNVDAFISTKLSGLVKMSAPLLIYDVEDTYSKMFDEKNDDDEIVEEKAKVSNPYRFISHNADVAHSINKLVGAKGKGAIMDFYSTQSADLPTDTESQTVNFELITSNNVDQYTILCYSTVHCLQPYQITAFDEIKGGVYYEHYAKRIVEMEQYQRYSMTPHLDKRWHKHGAMPYINVAKENERRLDLAKAFLYALCYGKIGYVMDGADSYLVFQDSKLNRPAEIIFYKGKTIPYSKINRGMNWLADQDELIERYSSLFDNKIEEEIDKLSKYGDSVGQYKTGITNYADILKQMKRNIIRAINVVGSGNGRTKQQKTKEGISIIELAWMLHRSEENEIDKDYAELLISVLCMVIKKYAKAPYNARHIEEKVMGSEAYINYTDVRDHVAKSFLAHYAKACKISNAELIGFDGTAEVIDETSSNTKAFGVNDTDITDDVIVTSETVSNKSFEWASAEISKGIKE